MPTASGTWRLSIGGFWVSNLCCQVANFDDLLLSGPGQRGSNVRVPYMQGSSARIRMYDEVTKPVLLNITGSVDSDGNSQDATLGLVTNLDELKQHLRPNQAGSTRAMRIRLSDTSFRSADVQVSWPWQVSVIAPGEARVAFDVTIPEGVLRSETEESETFTTAGSHVMPNPGTADQYASIIEIAGAQTITNNDFGGAWLEYVGSLPITVNTQTMRATYDGSGDDAAAEIAYGGHFRWLPLSPDDNDITLATGADVTWTHAPAYL